MPLQRVVVFELNEVPWRIVDWWVDRRPRSAMRRLLDGSSQYTSVAPDEGHLSPWVTWPTVHRGVPNTVHGIGHFGQDTTSADAVAPPWWTVAVGHGRRVGVFGLLHTSILPADVERYAFFVPDTFAPSPDTHPRSLEVFQEFNLRMARASARNVSTSIDTDAARRLVLRMPALGVRPSTAARVAAQLLGERRRPETRVRRRSLQSVLAFDLFERQLRRTAPDAAAFFTNHVASAMHRYWAATFPADYPPESFGFDEAWVSTWSGELEVAMAHADRMIGRLHRYCERTGTMLVVASSMGQQAAQGTPVSRQLYLRDVDAFVRDAGVDPATVERRPAMDPDVSITVSPVDAERLRDRLRSLRIGGQEVRWDEADGFFALAFGQADDAIGDITVDGTVREPASLGFEIVEIEDAAVSTGYHVAEGIVLVHDPSGRRPVDASRATMETTEIAPLVLDALDVAHHADR